MQNIDVRALRRERLEVQKSIRPFRDKRDRGERLNFDERSALNRAHDRIVEIDQELLDAQDQAEARELSAAASRQTPGAPGAYGTDDSAEARAFTRYVRTGATSPELRAAGEATNSAGGFLVPPGWWQRLQIALKAYGGVARDFDQLETDTGQPMQWATNDPTNVVGSLIAENTQISDVDYVFGQGTFSAYLYSSGVHKISRQLAQDSAFDTEGFIETRVGESIGRAMAAAAISGTGSSQPLGIITALGGKGSAGTAGGAIAATGGFVTLQAAQKVQMLSSVAATAGTDLTATELGANVPAPSTVFAMIEAVDPAYRALGAKFYLNSNQLSSMRRVVDNYGRPFWPTLYGADPDLVGYPVEVDNNIPNLTLSTAGGPIFGHLQTAMVKRTVSNAGLQRLDERYADFLQVGYIGYLRFDIRSNDLRAAVTVKAGGDLMTDIRTLVLDGGSYEYRAMGESTTGGDLVKPGFADSVIRLMKEYQGFLADCEDLETETGAAWKRPQVSSLVASGAVLAENTQQTSYGGDATGTMTQVTFAGQQSFGQTPVYVARLAASVQLAQDANVDLEALLADAAAESIGRQLAAVVNPALYAAATAGQEATLTTLSATSLAKLLGLVDPAYLKGAKFYMCPADAALVFGSTSAILANSDGLHLFGFPVQITNACTPYVSTTVTGPVFGNLGRFMTMRRAGGLEVQVLRERYADWAQIAVNCYARVDFATRGEPAAVAFSK